MLNNDIVINSISHYVYKAIVTVRQRHPNLLIEKYRKYAWDSNDLQARFIAKLTEKLDRSSDRDRLVLKLIEILETIFTPSFFVSVEFTNLIAQIRKYTHPVLEIEANQLNIIQNKEAAIAILLLDAENLQLDAAGEKILAEVCTYPIQIKVAFANWRNLGKKDIEFHGRGYELIHVPPGKDSADVKMATVGSSIFVHYPTAKEVLVCSCDGVMTHLCTTLQTHGFTVYLVRQQKDYLTVLNTKTGQNKIYSLISSAEIPSIDRVIDRLQEIIIQEQKQTGNHWIKLSKISTLFKQKYQFTLSEAISKNLPEKKTRDLFLDYPDRFVLHQPSDTSEIYISAFSSVTGKSQDKDTAIVAKAENTNDSTNKIKSKVDLEIATVKIVKILTLKAKTSYVPIAHVAAEFNRQYNQGITKAIAKLDLKIKFPNLLKSYSSLEVKQVGQEYHVAIVSAK
jgi:hypothetical protein